MEMAYAWAADVLVGDFIYLFSLPSSLKFTRINRIEKQTVKNEAHTMILSLPVIPLTPHR